MKTAPTDLVERLEESGEILLEPILFGKDQMELEVYIRDGKLSAALTVNETDALRVTGPKGKNIGAMLCVLRGLAAQHGLGFGHGKVVPSPQYAPIEYTQRVHIRRYQTMPYGKVAGLMRGVAELCPGDLKGVDLIDWGSEIEAQAVFTNVRDHLQFHQMSSEVERYMFLAGEVMELRLRGRFRMDVEGPTEGKAPS